MDKTLIKVYSQVAALNVLVAHALAVAIREHDDPRGTMRHILLATEQQLADTMNSLRESNPGEAAEALSAMSDASRENVLYVAGMVDSLLRHMGAPPASDV